MPPREKAVAKRRKVVRDARRRDDLDHVDPHCDPSKGGAGYLARERERAAGLYLVGERDETRLEASRATCVPSVRTRSHQSAVQSVPVE